jgi:hypothetical protein
MEFEIECDEPVNWQREGVEMNYALYAALYAFGLFLGMLFFQEIGRRVGLRRLAGDPTGAMTGISTTEGAVFGLLGLLIGFTFSGAMTRFDAQRQLIVEEANDIGTAYLRLDLLPADAQPALRESFQQYLDARLSAYHKLPDVEAAQRDLARSVALQKEIWNQAVIASASADTFSARMLLLPALNAMIDITTTRTMAGFTHPPAIIFVMIFMLGLAGSLLVGYDMAGEKTRSWLHILGFAFAITVSFYIILDLEFPRLGLIQVDAFDQTLVTLRESMK